MHWFRFHADALNDPKVQCLPADLFKRWVNTLCIACRHGGTLPDLPNLAFLLRCTEQEACAVLDQLIDAGLVDQAEEGLRPHNWDFRQYQSDSSTPRVRRFRKKKRTEQSTENREQKQNTDTEKKVSRNDRETFHPLLRKLTLPLSLSSGPSTREKWANRRRGKCGEGRLHRQWSGRKSSKV